ncbi:hypothetical protein CR513_61025, partial [Mucuna pruriens]
MDQVFTNQIGKNLEVYVDDMMVKSISPEQHKYNMRQMYIWGATRKVLGFHAYSQGNKIQPRQVRNHHQNEKPIKHDHEKAFHDFKKDTISAYT